MQLPTVTPELVSTVYRRALRTGKYWKLRPEERAVLRLSTRILSRIKSQVLREILLKIIEKISPKLARKIRALEIGFEILKRRVEQALMLGYSRAKEWLKDLGYAFYLGISYLNTPLIYQGKMLK